MEELRIAALAALAAAFLGLWPLTFSPFLFGGQLTCSQPSLGIYSMKGRGDQQE